MVNYHLSILWIFVNIYIRIWPNQIVGTTVHICLNIADPLKKVKVAHT